MIVSHVKPESWVDTGEAGKIQPSEVAGLAHVVSLSPEDVELLRGPQGLPGADGAMGPQGPAGPAGGGAAGMVAFFATANAPGGWLKADGALVSRATYAALFAAIGTVFGAGDGATTFKLPDLRGEFVRGLDGGRGVDAGRTLGSAQADEVKAHGHDLKMKSIDGGAAVSGVYLAHTTANGLAGGSTSFDRTSSGSVAPTAGVESRPRNVALLACICTG